MLARFDGCATAKVKVAERGPVAWPTTSPGSRRSATLWARPARVRVDANGGWYVDEAREALPRWLRGRAGLEYAEQPCATRRGAGRAAVALARRGVDVPVAADESIRKADGPDAGGRAGAADVVVVKVAPLGGVASALAIARRVRAAGRSCLGRWTRRSGSRPGWRWRPRCPSCRTPAGCPPSS